MVIRGGNTIGEVQTPKRGRSDTKLTYSCRPKPEHEVIVTTTGRDSDLEAFSYNPSGGSLAPLPYQAST